MESSEEEDPIEAFFKGKIVKNVRSVQPTINSVKIPVKYEEEPEGKYKRKFVTKFEKHVIERDILNAYLNAPVEMIDNTLGIQEVDENKYSKPEDLLVYQKYEFHITPQNLPILQKHDRIIDMINQHSVVILKSDTGTGKSSQVPQYILEDCSRRNVPCNIIITQPKKISALSLATRVAFERKCELGSLVGYQIGLDKNMDAADTRILFCTTGVFLHKLVHFKSLEKWTHIIIDEIHERDLDMDMVLLIIRRLMVATKSKAKIILMSATLNCDKIANYFRLVEKPPILDLNVKKPYPVKFHYLDEFEHLGANKEFIDMSKPIINHNMLKLGIEMVNFFAQKGADSFLIFLPGIYEINCFHRELQVKREGFDIKKFHIYILHSTIPLANMKGLYDTSLKNKIILATNIAESSLTIPGIRIVIDYCLTKYLEVDSASSLTQLKLSWASKMNMEQRAGRTGRTSVGQIIRMLYQKQYDSLPNEGRAEMQRTSLETVVLKAKNLQMGRPSDILAIALDPPERSAIIDAILMLKEVGAMTRFTKNIQEFDFLDGNLTFAGIIMSNLPVDIRLSKLILLGHAFSVLKECIVIAAGLSVGSIFKHENSINAFETKLNHDSSSDLIAILNAFTKYNEFIKNNRNQIDSITEERWCINQMLNYKNVKEMTKQVEDIQNRLKQFNILADNFRYTTEEKLFTIKVCIAGAFYPNFYTFGGNPPGREEFKYVLNKNLCSTVYFQTNRPIKNGQLYEKLFRELLFDAEIIDCEDDAQVTFDNQKIIVQFNNLRNKCDVKMPGDVKLEVHRALKSKSIKKVNDFKLYTMYPEHEETFLSQETRFDEHHREIISADLKLKAKYNIYPNFSIHDEEKHLYFTGKITHIVSPSKFYFQPAKAKGLMDRLKDVIGLNLQKIDDIFEKIENERIMVLHGDQFKRGQILESNKIDYKVLLIDFGEIVTCTIEDFFTGCAVNRHKRQDLLREFFKLSPMCYECKLAELRPTAKQQYGWSRKAIDEFKNIVRHKAIKLKLYAFNPYDKIASVVMHASNYQDSQSINVNSQLIHLGLADYTDESYTYKISKTMSDNFESLKYSLHKEHSIIDYPRALLMQKCNVTGPFSPLINTGQLQHVSRPRECDISIDQSSVNCTLVDPYPYDGIKKLLVTSTKSLTHRGNITLQQTTMMPFSKGLCSLLALIFAPNAEIRYDKNKTRITSVLTGLGCDFEGKPYFAEHDCLIRTDIEIDDEDMNWINSIRKEMSVLMQQYTNEAFEYQACPIDELIESRSLVCSLLLKIIKKQRLQLGISYADSFDWINSTKKEPSEGLKNLPKINHTRLNPIPRDSIRFMINHFKDLERKAKYNSRDEYIDCFACDEQIETLVDLKNHLLNIKHFELETKYMSLDRDTQNSSYRKRN